MAYPTVSQTYGFKPIQRLDGLPYAGEIRQIPISAGYATAILNGDTVAIAGGYITATASTNSGYNVGVLVGCQYVNSSGQVVQGQSYPAAQSTATALAYAYVVDDPYATFKVVATNAGSTTAYSASRTVVGLNVPIVFGAGSTTSGDSAYGIDISAAASTSTFPVRIVDVVPDTASGPRSNNATVYYEFIVKFNLHEYNNTLGA
jgi:hypothetical protein